MAPTPSSTLEKLVGDASMPMRQMPVNLNMERVGRLLLFDSPSDLVATFGPKIPHSEIDATTARLAPRSLARLHGRIQAAADVTVESITVLAGSRRFEVTVDENQFLHLNREYFLRRQVDVLGLVRSVPRQITAALIVCD